MSLPLPNGIKMSGTPVAASVTNSAGDALFTTSSAHGLTTDDTIYARGVIENYNGLFYVTVISPTTFKLQVFNIGFVQFINIGTVDIYTSLGDVNWLCAHLPIVYKRQNNRWPVNSVDTARTVSSSANESGFMRLNLSGSLSFFLIGAVQELDFIIISGAASPEVNGVYQVLDIPVANSYTINFPYNSVYSYAGASVLPYYQNYHTLIKVYVGLDPVNPYEAQRPYELAGTLKLIPDSENIVKFSIHDIVKSYVKTKNNLTLGTLPNNIDAYTNFYIEDSVSFDKSNGYTLGTYEDTYTQYGNIGYAVNAKLPFKNKNSGALSDYIMKQNFIGKFLTVFAIPVLFSCSDCNYEECVPYQDVSCIIDIDTQVLSSTFSNFDANLDGWFNSSSGTTAWIWSSGNGGSALLQTFFSTTPKSLTFLSPVIPTSSVSSDESTVINFTVVRTNNNSTNLQFRFRALNSVGGILLSSSQAIAVGSQVLSFNLTQSIISQISKIEVTLTATSIASGDLVYIPNVFFTYNEQKEYLLRRTFFKNNIEQISFDTELEINGSGVYRIPMYTDVNLCAYDRQRIYIYTTEGIYDEENVVSEVKSFDINCDCAELEVRTNQAQSPVSIPYEGGPTISPFVNVSGGTGNTPGWFNSGGCLANNVDSGSSDFATIQESFTYGQYRVSFTFTGATNLEVFNFYMGGTLVKSVTHSDSPQSVSFTFWGGGQDFKIQMEDGFGDTQILCGFLLESIVLEDIATIPRKTDLMLTWQNNLGGFDYWKFIAGKDIMTDVVETGEQTTNIFPDFGDSYGEFADTIRRQTHRESRKQMRVRSQNLTLAQVQAISTIRESILVQIIKSRTDRRTVIVDNESFVQYREYEDRLYTLEFTISFTDDNPVQTV